ncbi:hypothetical protein [Winogradskyella tangerina]|uniref:hypothetical protein n=1 Tax=Winogradskyella tangerina TaxID=2023240 RepID=UPI000DBE88D1|nr:hypothetical protein [Winogradskyella tangerina]
MRKIPSLLLLLLLLNCNNERVLQLPEIENAEITELLDVSPAYIFYDESQPDSTLFNRKNLISTTNWAVNVDKRLTLRQAIPHIQYLLDKRKKKSMHTNENAKNYFTCNDTSIGNLGFLEFTEVNYLTDLSFAEKYDLSDNKIKPVLVHFISEDYVALWQDSKSSQFKEDVIKIDSLFTNKYLDQFKRKNILIQLVFTRRYNFQKYIGLKNDLNKFFGPEVEFSKDEIIF